jgi:hypothetical protein
VKLLASERMTDNDDGGGMVRGNVVIQDGVSNAIFPDISELDRTYGRVNLRKVFVAVQTGDTDVYYGAHVILEDAPDDPLVSASLFSTEDWSDERTAAVSRLESYLARGAKTAYYLWETHITGQMALACLAPTSEPLPSVGTTIVLARNPGLSTEMLQYVRITSVASETRDFTYISSGSSWSFTRQVFTLSISDPLEFDLVGGIANPMDDANLTTSRIYDTVVADAARYFGIRPLTMAMESGDLTVQADTIYHPLVPSAQTEIPVVDAKPNGDAIQVTASMTGTAVVTTTVDFDPTHALYVGQAILPGTLSMTTGTGATLTDDNGVLMSGATQVGIVDYANGLLMLNAGAPDYGTATKNITFRPGAAPSRSVQSAAFDVTTASRSQTIVTYLDPIPQPGTLRVSFMAQGKWYVLQDHGAGKLKGADASFGSGTVSFVSGSVIVTLGALPDVGSAVLFNWGLATTDVVRAGATIKAMKKIQLTNTPVMRNSVVITWPNGSGGTYTASDDGSGLISGDATGAIEYSKGTLYIIPNVLPPGGAEMDVDYNTGVGVEVTFNDPAIDGNGRITVPLPDTDILPGSVTLTWGVNIDENAFDIHYSFPSGSSGGCLGFSGFPMSMCF